MNWEDVRQAYPAQTPLMNFNNAAVSPSPKVVQEAVHEYLRMISQNPDFNMWSNLDTRLPETKRRLSVFADCLPEEVALNRNASEGLATVIFGIPLAAGDEVLTCPWDYPSAITALAQRSRREGIRVAQVDFGLMDDDEAVIAAYTQAITPRTRVMLLTHMIHWTGKVLPVKKLCELARQHGIITLVDAAQSFAHLPLSFRDIGCDYLVASLHKWLGAPVGNGILIVRQPLIKSTYPLLGTFDLNPEGIEKFDHWNLGTYNSAMQAAIPVAMDFYSQIGVEKFHARLRHLSRYWVDQARSIPGFTLHTRTEDENLGAVVLFSIEGMSSLTLEKTLRQEHDIHVKYRKVGELSGMRVSPHVYMTERELDAFAGVLRMVVARG